MVPVSVMGGWYSHSFQFVSYHWLYHYHDEPGTHESIRGESYFQNAENDQFQRDDHTEFLIRWVNANGNSTTKPAPPRWDSTTQTDPPCA